MASAKQDTPRKRKASSASSFSMQATMDDFIMSDNLSTKPKPITTHAILPSPVPKTPLLPLSISHTALVLKHLEPFKNELPVGYFDSAWDNLHAKMLSVLAGEASAYGLQLAHNQCQNICSGKEGFELYSRFKQVLVQHINGIVKDLEAMAPQQSDFLIAMNKYWCNMCSQLIKLRNIFIALDSSVVLRATSDRSLVDLGKRLFRTHITTNRPMEERLIANVLFLIESERDKETVDRALIKSLLNMMVDLSVYSTNFEPRFLEETTLYYQKESETLMKNNTIQAYIYHANKRRDEEQFDRVEAYLDASSKTPLLEVVTYQLFHRRIEEILSKGFDQIMDSAQLIDAKEEAENILREEARDQLKILYTTFTPEKGHLQLRQAFGEYIKKRGTTIVMDPANDPSLVVTLLDRKKRLDTVLSDCFMNDITFANTLKESFEVFVNTRKNKPAELVAKYIDSKLRSNTKNKEKNIEQVLDQAMVIFRYTQSKDTFEAFYKRLLAKRLLLNKVTFDVAEKSILSKLKEECGPDYTKDLEAMFNDMSISEELHTSFKESEGKNNNEMSMYANVLATSTWPSTPVAQVNLPPDMVAQQTAFASYYATRFKGRLLTWRNAMGYCTLKAYFPGGVKDLMVSLFQAAVLLLFNDSPSGILTYSEIATATKIEENELKRVLKSLACGKHQVLSKSPVNSTIKTSDHFVYNTDFTADAVRLKINSIQSDNTAEESKETENTVLFNRQCQV
ncbi:cullin 4, partial [Spinellus fusiger]